MLCAVSLLAFAGAAWAEDAAPVDLKALAQTLKEIKAKRAVAEKNFEARVQQDFRTAASSNAAAIAFYDRAVQAIQPDKPRADLQEWEKSEAAQNATRLHLSYLLLTLQRSAGATTQQLEPALLAHIAALTDAGAKDDTIQYRRDREQELKDAGYRLPKGKVPPARIPLFWEQELIKQSVKSSIFVQWYGAASLLEGAKEWEFSPGNADGMYQSTLLPYYRQTKNPRLLAYWDHKIQQETQDANKSGVAFKIDQFNTVRRPQLVWQRALDMIAIGLRNRAMTDMLTLVKTYPDHPDLANWITQLEGMLPGAAAPQAPVPSASPTPGSAAPGAN